MLRYLIILIVAFGMPGCRLQTKTATGNEELYRSWRKDKYGCTGYRKNNQVDALIDSMSKKVLLASLGKPDSRYVDKQRRSETLTYFIETYSCGQCSNCSARKRFEYPGEILQIFLQKDSSGVLKVTKTVRTAID